MRHGESAGNVARNRALAERAALIDIDARDCDVPLSELGERQARALGLWLPRNYERPKVLLASPYLRARQTAQIALEAAGWTDVPTVADERLREKEFGILDRLTRTGIEQQYPEQAAMRDSLGKFYYRPPGGESWTDVLLRLRSIIDTLTREYSRQRVCIVSHQVVVLCFRYLLERMNETEILAVDRANEIANCSLTTYRFDPAAGTRGKLCLAGFNVVAPMEEAGAAVTTSPDVPVARK
ncbi:MAG: histidine phosphatase family protein [Candidatus Velthaea sp.]